ncbi:hypothetical protein G9A89_008571 [Geosiphon pyriformis]|nr:hypothetical protein G9A89_008571 [Geosiphon pyriformis]
MNLNSDNYNWASRENAIHSRSLQHPNKKPMNSDINKFVEETVTMAISSNVAFCGKADPLKGYDITGPKLTKHQWANRQPNFVAFEIDNILPDKLVRVDEEWQKNFLSIKKVLFTVIEGYFREIKSIENFNIYFTGWGVGGAYATIAALTWKIETYLKDQKSSRNEFKFSNLVVKAVTFGAPRIGNVVFAQLANKWLEVSRVTHSNDHVPHFPKRETGRYFLGHNELEFWITLTRCDCPEELSLWECQGFYYESRAWKSNKILDGTLFPHGGKSGENMECNAGQSIDDVPRDFIHSGPYMGTTVVNTGQTGFESQEQDEEDLHPPDVELFFCETTLVGHDMNSQNPFVISENILNGLQPLLGSYKMDWAP